VTVLNNEDPADPSVHEHDEPTVVWGVPALLQKAAFEKHCTGDCGKISMGGVIDDAMTGGLFVCCEVKCPHEKGVIKNYGSTNSFGRPHTVHLRALKEDA
jgi:hypothetical protein